MVHWLESIESPEKIKQVQGNVVDQQPACCLGAEASAEEVAEECEKPLQPRGVRAT